jgi:hypothetical protein
MQHTVVRYFLCLLAAGQASSRGLLFEAPREQQIQWGKVCHPEINTTHAPAPAGITCGSLTVPLDYTEESLGATIELELIKLPALRTPSKGSILLNFGGPGPNGRMDFSMLSEQLRV